MKRKYFNVSVSDAFNLLLNLKLTSWDRRISAWSLVPSKDYLTIALSSESNYEEVYKAGLQFRTYNFMLTDYSYFQFWHDPKGYQLKTLRYAYCPNPYDLVTIADFFKNKSNEHQSINIHEILDQALLETPLKIGKPPIRYDLAIDNHIEIDHPASHLTIGGHTKNRWPVSRILTPKLFVLFVCRHYYSEQWIEMTIPGLSLDGFLNHYDQVLADEKRASRLLDMNSFTDRERLHLFID